jgi:hypothetical protein
MIFTFSSPQNPLLILTLNRFLFSASIKKKKIRVTRELLGPYSDLLNQKLLGEN